MNLGWGGDKATSMGIVGDGDGWPLYLVSAICLLLVTFVDSEILNFGCLPQWVTHHHFVRAYFVWRVEQGKGRGMGDRLGSSSFGKQQSVLTLTGGSQGFLDHGCGIRT